MGIYGNPNFWLAYSKSLENVKLQRQISQVQLHMHVYISLKNYFHMCGSIGIPFSWVLRRLTHQMAMYPDAPYFGILLCLTPDDFTRQVESAATQWVKGLTTQRASGI